MSEFFQYLLDLCRSVIRIFWSNQPTVLNKHNIFIRSNTGNTILLDVNPKWDIKNVKEIIAPKLGTNPEEVKIIFAGKELSDSIMIEECDLGQQSILHAVDTKSRSNVASSSTDWTYESLLTENIIKDVASVDANPNEGKPHFYIYCASVCKSLQIGKLRVRCDRCKSGAVIVDSDPRSWSDVLTKKRITCVCNQDDCNDGSLKWAEFYFKCSNHISCVDTDVIIPFPLIKNNIWNVHCLTCTDVKSPVLIFPCDEKHVTCVDCFVEYASIRLRDRQFVLNDNVGYTLPCPARCENSYIDDCNYFKLLTKDQYETYQRFAVEDFVLKSGGVLCPQPGCGAGILVDPNCDRVVCQNECEYVFCRKCLQGYHIGECEEINRNDEQIIGDHSLNPEQANNARWNEASRIAIRQCSKPCPRCRTPTEKNGGCMHMVCSRCEYNWCWICQIEWGRDCMSSHWDQFEYPLVVYEQPVPLLLVVMCLFFIFTRL